MKNTKKTKIVFRVPEDMETELQNSYARLLLELGMLKRKGIKRKSYRLTLPMVKFVALRIALYGGKGISEITFEEFEQILKENKK